MTIAASPPPPLAPAVERRISDNEGCFAVIDLETTGLDSRTGRILECAVLLTDSFGRVVSEWSTLLTIPGSDEPGARAIHGISRDMLESAPTFREVAAELAARLSGRIVVGHVLAFDLEHLRAEFSRAGACLPELSPSGLCTRELARTFLPPGSRTLAACCAAVEVPLEDPHTALGDARAASSLLKHFIAARYPIDYETRARRARTVLWPNFAATGPHPVAVRTRSAIQRESDARTA